MSLIAFTNIGHDSIHECHDSFFLDALKCMTYFSSLVPLTKEIRLEIFGSPDLLFFRMYLLSILKMTHVHNDSCTFILDALMCTTCVSSESLASRMEKLE